MSGPERPPEPKVPTTKLKRKDLSDEDQKELDALDRIFKRIKPSIPQAPYILSTPSLNPYHYHSQHEANAWMMGHLFTPKEEHLQYRTFHYREPYQDCFVLQNGEDEEPEPEPERPKSKTSNTALQGGPKKKISLSDYKSKQANGVITPGSKKLSPNLAATRIAPVQTNGVKKPEKQPAQTQKHQEVKLEKRPAPEPLIPETPEKRAREANIKVPPLQKTESVDTKTNLDKSHPSNSTPHGLPPMLSPVDQPLSNPYGLPAILSPTLPSNIQAELDKLETQRKRAESNASTSSSDRKSQLLSVPDGASQKQEEGSKSNPRARSVSVNGRTPVSPNRDDPSGPSLVVKLKFSKQKKATVDQILRLPPKRISNIEKKDRQETPKNSPVKTQAKADGHTPKPIPKIAARRHDASTPTAKATPLGTKTVEKRPRTEEDASLSVPVKKHKAQSSQDGPNTPTQQMVSSPVMSSKSSAQKSQGPYATPKKDHRAVNMLRTNSTESQEVTPGRSGVTPTGSRHLDVKAPTSAPLTGKKQADISLLSQTSKKLNQMGRSLKHEAQKVIAEKGNKVGKEDEKRAAVTSLESILSYMAAYHAQDLSLHLRGRPGEVEGTWKTLLPLCMFFARTTKNFQHLDGLRSHLSAVIAAAICAHVAQRAPNPKAHDSPHDIPHSELAKQHSLLGENFGLLSDHFRKLLRHTQEARLALPMDEIQTSYRKTWASRETDAKLAKDPEKLNGSRLSGPYFLPIQTDTTPIQAVRFGLKFLSEYCEKENLDYILRVNLDKPE